MNFGDPTFSFIIFAMIGVFYFFMIRPQQKKAKQEERFVDELSKGKKVVTSTGIHGKVVSIDKDKGTMKLEIDSNTSIKIDRIAISMDLTEKHYGK
ncbi:MAG: preprotein translocase subunit YajC [Saprospirales bacterium TMED214]|nr:MAG: preprotein translocase subunit YajC [Saprospirales bacterium TMED214]